MVEEFETRLTGGHPNSLGRTVDLVDAVLADRARLAELYAWYFSRNDSSLERDEEGDDRAATQWMLALLLDLTRALQTPAQHERSLDIMKRHPAGHADWIVLYNSMPVLHEWSLDDPVLAKWFTPHLERLAREPRRSVAARATKLLAKSKQP
jgi:hypothetical protein